MADNADPWNVGYVSDKRINAQQHLSKLPVKHHRAHPYRPEKEAEKCFSSNFKIPSSWLEQPHLAFFQMDYSNSSSKKVFTTDPSFSKYCKLTLQAVSNRYLYEIRDAFFTMVREASVFSSKDVTIIPREHCTGCYKSGHERTQCRVCSYCLELGHIRQTCPDNPRRELFVSTITHNNQRANKKRNIRFRPYDSRPWFRRPNEFERSYLDHLQPIGPRNLQLETLAIDIEGSGPAGGPDCVNVCGWVGNKNGQAHDLYFVVIRVRRKLKNPATGITGNQVEDLWDGTPIEEVRDKIKSMLPGRRVVTHGGNDLDLLGIDETFLQNNRVITVDTSKIFNESGDKQSIGLAKIVKFFDIKFWDRNRPCSLIQGHSSEKDARATLKCYQRAMTLLNNYHQLPSKEEIEHFIFANKTWIDWREELSRFYWRRNPSSNNPEIIRTGKEPTAEEIAFATLFDFPDSMID